MKNCFKGLVSLKGICESEGDFYINDLSGISFKKFSKTANEEDVTGKELFYRLEREAISKLCSDAMQMLYKQGITFKEVLKTEIVGDWKKYDFDYYDREDLFVGREFRNNSDDYYCEIKVDWIEINVKETLNKRIHIVDAYDKRYIDVVLRPGVNRVPINYKGDFVRIFFNICNVSLIKEDSCSCNYENDCSCECSCSVVKKIERDKFDKWGTSNIMAFRACVSCVADKNKMLCKYTDQLKYALRYGIAAALMDETVYSDRKNPLVRNSKENAEKYLVKLMGGEDPFTGMKQKSLYYSELAKAINIIKHSIGSSKAIICSGRRIVEETP